MTGETNLLALLQNMTPSLETGTLTLHSSLEATGLTAVFATALAKAGISCNVVAAYYHDHIFVAKSDGERALQVLQELSRVSGK